MNPMSLYLFLALSQTSTVQYSPLVAIRPGCTVLKVLPRQSCLAGLTVLFWQSCLAGLTVLFWQFCPAILPWISYRVRPVLQVLLSLLCSACYFLPVNSVCPVLAVMSSVETKMPFTILRKCVFVKIVLKSSLKFHENFPKTRTDVRFSKTRIFAKTKIFAKIQIQKFPGKPTFIFDEKDNLDKTNDTG